MASVRFILGRAGSGKTTKIVDEIVASLANDSLGDPILLLVPDQATLLYERLIAEASASRGYLRLQVITFRQLVDVVLREGGGAAIPEITPLGRRILIGRLLRRLQPQLQFYRSSARQPGLADRLDDAFAEVEHAGLTGDQLDHAAADIESATPQSALPAKLRDLRLLMSEYARLLGSDRLDQHRRLSQSLEAIERSATIARAEIYVDGFDEFTRGERQLLARIAQAGSPTTVALAMNPADASPAAQSQPLPEDHPFRAATHAFRRLIQLLQSKGISSPTITGLGAAPRFESVDLKEIAKRFLSARPGTVNASAGIHFIEATTARSEVDAAARQIVDWLRQGLRLREILVLARDINPYARDIEASFGEQRIPHFVDRQLPASHHPLIRAIRSLVQIALTDWRIDAVTELAKSGLAGITDIDCDALENYLLAHRIRGVAAWQSPWSFKTTRHADDELDQSILDDTERINASRAHLLAGVQPLLKCDDDHRCTATQWCQRMCESLTALGVSEALSKLITELDERGDFAEAARHREVWTTFSELLDQLAAVLGDEALSLREFAEVIDVAFERFVFTVAPPTVDQVLVGSVSRTHAGPVKACIVLGLSEGIFPQRQENARILSDDDRLILDARQAEIAPGSRIAQLDEQLFAYQAFTRASQKLTITRPARDADGRRLAPSLFWTQLQSFFRGAPIEKLVDAPRGVCISTPRDLSLALLHWSRDDLDRKSAGQTAIQLAAFERTATHLDIVKLRGARTRAHAYKNEARLSTASAAALFPSPLLTSATRLETFAACPFRHFAQHALKLAPHEETRLTPLDLGTVYHRVLDKLVRGAIQAHHDFATKLPRLADRLSVLGEQAVAELRSELLLSPGRQDHLLTGVRKTLDDVVETQRLALAMGSFRPANTEFAFGLDANGTPPFEIGTPAGRTVALRGKIDRVDTFEIADRLAATVIDYKLGKRQAKFDEIYYGLSLQLVTYLLVLSALGKKISGRDVAPAAAFYVRLLRSVESVAHPDDAAEIGTDAFHLSTANKARGVIDERFVEGLDQVTTKGSSAAYGLNKSAEPVSVSRLDVIEHDVFESLLTWTRSKVAAIGDQIMDGIIAVYPYRLRTITPCSNCDYRSVCRFEVAESGYKWIEPKGKARLAQMAGEATP